MLAPVLTVKGQTSYFCLSLGDLLQSMQSIVWLLSLFLLNQNLVACPVPIEECMLVTRPQNGCYLQIHGAPY